MINYEKIDALVASMKDELIADMKRWISVPSVQGAPAENAPFGLETRRMLDSGIDCILTNDFQIINETVKAWKEEHHA